MFSDSDSEGVLWTGFNILDLPSHKIQLRKDEKKGPLGEVNKRIRRLQESKKEDFFRPGFSLLLVCIRLCPGKSFNSGIFTPLPAANHSVSRGVAQCATIGWGCQPRSFFSSIILNHLSP